MRGKVVTFKDEDELHGLPVGPVRVYEEGKLVADKGWKFRAEAVLRIGIGKASADGPSAVGPESGRTVADGGHRGGGQHSAPDPTPIRSGLRQFPLTLGQAHCARVHHCIPFAVALCLCSDHRVRVRSAQTDGPIAQSVHSRAYHHFLWRTQGHVVAQP